MTNILIKPVEVVRGEYGVFVHPDLSAAIKAQFGQRDFYTQHELCDFAGNQNIELEQVSFELDAPEELQEKYYGGDDPDISAWNPSPPNDKEGWFIVSLHDTEDGPVCWWARRLDNENQPKSANCQYCDDGDGGCIFPHFGLAPHIHIGEQMIGSTQFLDQSNWPANFSPDKSGTGVYTHCLSCGAPDNSAKLDMEQETSPREAIDAAMGDE